MRRIRAISAILFFSFFATVPLYAVEGLNASAGFKYIYSKDENVLQDYYKIFSGAGWSGDLFDTNAAYYRWISYSVTDQLLNTKEIGIHQPEFEISVNPGDIISLDLGYSFFTGDSSYTAHRYSSGLLLDFEKTDLSVDYSFKECEYEFGAVIRNLSHNAGAELSLDITDDLSWDVAYNYERTDYRAYGYVYNKHTGRIGLLYIISVNCFIMGGVSGSRDSSDVVSAMADAGLTVKLYDHVKLGAIYMFTAEFYRSTTSETAGPGSKSETSLEADVNHTGSISISLYL